MQRQGKGQRRLSEVGCAVPCRNSGQCGDSQAGSWVRPLKTRIPRAPGGCGRARAPARLPHVCGWRERRREACDGQAVLRSQKLLVSSSECTGAARAPRSWRRGAMAGPSRSGAAPAGNGSPRGLLSDRPAPRCPAGRVSDGLLRSGAAHPSFLNFKSPVGSCRFHSGCVRKKRVSESLRFLGDWRMREGRESDT